MNMKWIYIALINGKVSAFHKKEKVIESYLASYKSSNPNDECFIAKARRDSVKKYEDLYLVETYEGIFVQQKYEDTFRVLFIDDKIHEMDEMKDNLLNLLFNGKSSKKEKKKILTSLDKLDEVIETEREISIPTLRQLEQGYWELEEYRDKAFN